MAVRCEYITWEKVNERELRSTTCSNLVTKPFKVLHTGQEMPTLGEMTFSNARCDEHYGLRNDRRFQSDILPDIDQLIETHGVDARPAGDGYIYEKEGAK